VPPEPASRNAIEHIADLAEGEDRDHRDAADPEEGQQQSTCHSEPKWRPCASRRAADGGESTRDASI